MARANKDEWDVRTNISPNPGAQGTLFSGGKKYSSDKRYPRGYTPERLAEVKESVDTSNVNLSFGNEATLRALHGYDKAKFVGDFGEPNRKLVDTIARSTVPTDSLLYTDRDRQKDDVIRFTTGHHEGSLGKDVAGHYVSRQLQARQGNDDARPVIAVTKGSEDTSTIIHEIGHHVDSEERGYHYHHGSNPVGAGQAEGRADAYADTHYRDRSGRPAKKWDYDPALVYPGDHQRQDSFRHGYIQGRHTGLPATPDEGPSVWKSISTPEGQEPMFNIATSPTSKYEFGPGGDKYVGTNHDLRFYGNVGDTKNLDIGGDKVFEPRRDKR